MTEISRHVIFKTSIRTLAATLPTFGRQNFVCDSNDIPVDLRYRIVTPAGYVSDLTENSLPYLYAGEHFGQSSVAIIPQDLMLTRWISAASAPYWVAGPGFETSVAAWAAENAATLDITDGTSTANVTAMDFTGITALEQILPVLTARTQAESATIAALATAEWLIDSLGRLYLNVPGVTGAAAPNFNVLATGLGTTHLDFANGTAQGGLDAETPQAALGLVDPLFNDYYNIGVRGTAPSDNLTENEALALAAYVETKRKQLDVITFDADVLSAGSTDDMAAALKSAGYLRTMCMYTEDSADLPDAALSGRCLASDPGLLNWAHKKLIGVSESGMADPISETEHLVLKDKRCTHIENIDGDKIAYPCNTAGGISKRIMLGIDAFDAEVQVKLYNLLRERDTLAFDDDDIGDMQSRIETSANTFINRKVISDTAARPFTITLPLADEIPDVERATQTFTELQAYSGWTVPEINDIRIEGYVTQ